MAYECLPLVDKCCFCCSLKVGSIIIAICLILFSVAAAGGYAYTHQEQQGATASYHPLGGLTKLACWFFHVSNVLSVFCGILLLIGILFSIEFLLTIGLALFVACVVLGFLVCFVLLLACLLGSCTKTAILVSVTNIIGPMFSLYFLIVVNSFVRTRH